MGEESLSVKRSYRPLLFKSSWMQLRSNKDLVYYILQNTDIRIKHNSSVQFEILYYRQSSDMIKFDFSFDLKAKKNYKQ